MSTDKTCGFSMGHYQDILETGVRSGYQFLRFDEGDRLQKNQKTCIIRHDIDYVPEQSICFAQIEKKLGIQAAYFFQVCAKPYNLREKENCKTVRELVKMGHVVGLHFDFTWKENVEWEELALLCESEKKVFQLISGVEPCEIISFHNPHRFADRILNQCIPGIRHTYEPDFFSAIKYISDSQGWYEGCMCELFRTQKYPAFQFLTHPYIWPEQSTGDFISDMAVMIKNRGEELLNYMIEFHPVCRKHQQRLKEEVVRLNSPDAASLRASE